MSAYISERFPRYTTLVIGAGGSKPYGYPTSKELVGLIVDTITNGKFYNKVTGRLESINTHTAARRLSIDLTNESINSIDFYLMKIAHNHPTLLEEGKRFITHEILKGEEKGKNNFNTTTNGKSWYHHIRDYLVKEIHAYPEILQKDNLELPSLRIITFNYDISLEYFLYTVLSKSALFEGNEIGLSHYLDKLKNCIIHVYGQVDKFKWLGGERDNAHYGRHTDNNTDWPFELASKHKDNLKLVAEERINSDAINSAQNFLWDSEKIYFLGFSFDPENISILDLPNKTVCARKIYYTNCESSRKIDDRFKVACGKVAVGRTGTGEVVGTTERTSFIDSVNEIHDALNKDFSFED